jgi:nucleoside-diphosphate-sugar epimerase
MRSDCREPINIGSSEMVTIDELVTIVERLAGVQLQRRYDTTAPKGVNGRNSDNTRIQATLGWAPGVPLAEGMEETYRWIQDQISSGAAVRACR